MKIRKGTHHGMTSWDYMTFFVRQGRACALCEEPPAPDTVLHWDHDHSCCPGAEGCRKCVRALVCGRCNSRIAVVENALRFDTQPVIEYLAKWAERQQAS